jgi:hypothetical protein
MQLEDNKQAEDELIAPSIFQGLSDSPIRLFSEDRDMMH